MQVKLPRSSLLALSLLLGACGQQPSPASSTRASAQPQATKGSPSASTRNLSAQASCGSTNVAQGKTATASSSEGDAYGASAAFDGNTATRWSSQFGDPQWLQVDLGSVQTLCKVTLNWEAAAAKSFSVLTSTDGTNWNTAYQTSSGNGGTQDISLNASARFVKLEGTARTTPYGYSLWEMSVFAASSGGGTPNPGTGNGASEINAIAPSAMPMPSGNAQMHMKLLNGTKGKYPDSKIYWGVLGINPADNKWSYLDIDGNLHPLSASLNNDPNALVRGNDRAFNFFHSLSEREWIKLPKITSGRMYLCVGEPCFIQARDNGFAGPNMNDSSDPNRNIYWDFIEVTINDTGYHGNLTRVDGFGLPLQMRVVNRDGTFDRTTGEAENLTRDDIFAQYKAFVPAEFTHLAERQAPYRILKPTDGEFRAGGQYGNYFDSYINAVWDNGAKPTSQDVFLCEGRVGQDASRCAGLNRHVFNENRSDVASYYKQSPANYYAAFWHKVAFDGKAYGFPYDDDNDQAAYFGVPSPKALLVRVGW